MHYEMLSRALAYVSCLSTTSLFLTTMAMAAIHAGKVSAPMGTQMDLAAISAKAAKDPYGALALQARVEAAARAIKSTKT